MNGNRFARLGRVPFLVLGIAALVSGIWGGLVRLPLNLPLPANNANWITFHGPLMVCGFLGTVIALERAVGLKRWWTYAAPLLTGAGALLLALGVYGSLPMILITVGSSLFLLVTARVVQLQRALFTLLMALAAAAWVCGNVLWWQGWPVPRVAPWWIAFLALTILGERLDLSRFQRPSPWSRPMLYAALALFGGGVLISAPAQAAGERVAAVGLVAMALWLGRFDLARRTVRQPGLPRFMALCLLVGFAWLGLAGAQWLFFAPLTSGLRYDAVLHSFFLGFVFSMIFGHAPVIFPAVLNLQPSFSARFYSHLVLLHLGLVLRVGGDLAGWGAGRQWGAVMNGLAVGLFLVNTVSSFVFRSRR